MPPLTRSRAGSDRVPTPMMEEYYAQRASAALIIAEATIVSEQATGYAYTPGIYNRAQIDGWSRVVDAVKARGGRIVLQLWHCGRISHSSMQPGGGIENRARFLMEVLEAVGEAWPSDRIGVRIAPWKASLDCRDSDDAALYSYLAEALGRRDLA